MLGRRLLVFLIILYSALTFAQERSKSGPLKGFVKAPTEHIINEREAEITTSSVQGVIRRAVGDLRPLKGVVFEIRGPGDSEKVTSTKTDDRGRFRIANVAEGTYKYKATLDGFQSEVGTLVVSKSQRNGNITIDLQIGM